MGNDIEHIKNIMKSIRNISEAEDKIDMFELSKNLKGKLGNVNVVLNSNSISNQKLELYLGYTLVATISKTGMVKTRSNDHGLKRKIQSLIKNFKENI